MGTIYNELCFENKGRYAVLGNLDASTKKILMVFHGQGQLALHFIQKFKCLQDKGIAIIAPEGLHHYYLGGFTGRVGASWMTHENRLVAIENYINFLEAVYNEVVMRASSAVQLHLLGFSQGTATLSRWVEQGNFHFEQFILWGATLPPDLKEQLMFDRLKGKKFFQVIGKNDPYITDEKKKEMKLLFKKYSLSPTMVYYQGGHTIVDTILADFFL